MRILKIKKKTVHACQYIPYDEQCGNNHGHTYLIENIKLVVKSGKFVNFNLIKKVIDSYDHKTFCPEGHEVFWAEVEKLALKFHVGIRFPVKVIKGSNNMNLCEEFAEQLAKEIVESNEHIIGVMFDVYEGDNQGCVGTYWKNEANFDMSEKEAFELIRYVASL